VHRRLCACEERNIVSRIHGPSARREAATAEFTRVRISVVTSVAWTFITKAHGDVKGVDPRSGGCKEEFDLL